MSIIKRWLEAELSPVSPLSLSLEGEANGARREEEEGTFQIVRMETGDSDSGDSSDSWPPRCDARLAPSDSDSGDSSDSCELDAEGLPCAPCACGGLSFWRPDSSASWHCLACSPDRPASALGEWVALPPRATS
jgi:hypothetical protein